MSLAAEPAREERLLESRESERDAAIAFAREVLARPRDASHRFLAITLPAPGAPIEAPLRALRKVHSFAFAPGNGTQIAGWGIADLAKVSVDELATGRPQSQRHCAELFASIARLAPPGRAPCAPRVFLGIAFKPGSAAEPPWQSFGDGLVHLPRWTYVLERDRASLVWTLETARASPSIAELEAVLDTLAVRAAAPPPPRIIRVEAPERGRWARSIEALRGAIERGELRKAVLARRAIVTAETDFDPLAIFARLDEEPDAVSTRFYVRAGRASFVGATPEHLFTLRGGRLSTEALAGSIASDAERGSDLLLESAKDAEEHAYVVRHIVERLAPLCERVAHADSPQVRRLTHVLHLRTPIDADLARNTSALDVLAALHPTPAIGGTPTRAALEWIERSEAAPRGWYGAPIGWMDADGNAEMLVALRCGAIQGGRAWLWAGAGIVGASDASAEWNETELKLQPMLRALGASR